MDFVPFHKYPIMQISPPTKNDGIVNFFVQ